MNKKAIELSMNFLVILVLSLVIFGLSITFILNIYGKAKGLQAKTFEDLDRQIGFLRCGTEQVCIGDKAKEIRRGEFGVYGIRVLNVYKDRTKFRVVIKPNQEVGEATDPQFNAPGHNLFLLPSEDSERIEFLDPDKSKSFALGVEVGKSLASGTYVVDVFVAYEEIPAGSGNFKSYGEAPKYKINVIVP